MEYKSLFLTLYVGLCVSNASAMEPATTTQIATEVSQNLVGYQYIVIASALGAAWYAWQNDMSFNECKSLVYDWIAFVASGAIFLSVWESKQFNKFISLDFCENMPVFKHINNITPFIASTIAARASYLYLVSFKDEEKKSSSSSKKGGSGSTTITVNNK